MALVGTKGICAGRYRLPEGATTLPLFNASTTSSGVKLCARKRSGSTVMTIARVLLPKGENEIVPGNWEMSIGRILCIPRSASSPSGRVLLSRTR